MAFFMVLILILQQKNDSPDLPFYFTLSFFYCFKNANSLPGKRSTAGCFYLIKPKKARIFGIFPKRKHCTIVSFVQCSYGWDSWIRTSGMTESKSVALPLGYTPISFVHMPTDQEHMFQYTIPFRKSQAFFQFGHPAGFVPCEPSKNRWFQRLFFSQFF